ncbi:hypothetical protein THERMOT_387 [Bathymodiolus thermophilus thioautotrophic gill symbiont]|uniref:hypothetical protein n=1 Tax=Bathymodiolus thermophilus thioautotrophic gill symbiont TaxID=2360 RepID=UPI00192BDF84|nr:hypothetical protein [Bathymodiolus thermophilus thioautotrophic gill symbiont]CAB5495838.1 hypothetical protein THERMOT_387 [Bathymodiolus thermophilus thioautotrophic gill symbiont]
MDYLAQFQGRFIGIMQWDDCRALFDKLSSNPNDWYVYDTSKVVPKTVTNTNDFLDTINNIKKIIKSEHQERYCGIVYTNDLDNPDFVKIFHPNNLGKSCGSSENPPIPQWLLSKIKPVEVMEKFNSPSKKKGFISKYFKL